MSKKQINLIKDFSLPRVIIQQGKNSSVNKRRKKIRWFFRILFFILILSIFLFTNVIFSNSSLITNLGRLSFWEGMARLMVGKDKILKGELFDRTNILILGMGGAQHEGPYLTDTIILASLKPSTQQVGLLSIPRDLYVPIPNYGWRKINSANALGMAHSKDGGLLTSQVVSNVFDIPIHYWIRVDFKLFKDLIDELDGVEVEVEKGFSDYQYPAANFSYQTISFEKGQQIMDGERALQFVRSRHGTNGEDSDFARSKRQQKILLAIKEKIEQENILTQPQRLWQIYNSFKNNISSNLDLSQAIRLAKLITNVDYEKITAQVIELEPKGPLMSEVLPDGAFVLKPKNGNFDELALMAKNLLNPESAAELRAGQQIGSLENLPESKPKVIILNGTNLINLAQKTGEELKTLGFEITQIGNISNKNYKENYVYKLNPLIEEEKTKLIQKTLSAKIIQEIDPDLKNLFDQNTTPSQEQNSSGKKFKADFLIILGGGENIKI